MARTFSTLFSESALRIALHTASDEDRFCSILEQRVANIKSYKNIFKANLPDEYAATGEGLEKGRGKGGGGSKGHPDEEDEDDPVKVCPKQLKNLLLTYLLESLFALAVFKSNQSFVCLFVCVFTLHYFHFPGSQSVSKSLFARDLALLFSASIIIRAN